jgi:hypothetical protein
MPLVYDRALNQFIFHPLDTALTDRQPKANKHRNKYFYTAPKIPNTHIANNRAKYQLFIQQVDTFALLFVVSGWIGIVIYFFHHPIAFSPIGLIFYLTIKGFAYIITNGLIFKYELENPDILNADLAARGMFFRDIQRGLQKRFPKLRFLFYEKYDCTKIKLDANFSKSNRNHKTQVKNLTYLINTNSEVQYRRKYKAPKIHDFLEKKYNFSQLMTYKIFWLSWVSSFVFEIPSEDGIFLVLPYFMGINGLTVAVFSLLFGFAHFKKYSVLNCLTIAFSTVFVILFILINYGLLTCIIGHILYDLFFLIPDLKKEMQETKKMRSLSSST